MWSFQKEHSVVLVLLMLLMLVLVLLLRLNEQFGIK